MLKKEDLKGMSLMEAVYHIAWIEDEWKRLMQEAKELGLSKEEVSKFLDGGAAK